MEGRGVGEAKQKLKYIYASYFHILHNQTIKTPLNFPVSITAINAAKADTGTPYTCN